ncbi:MAG TPA: hypothetical protein VM204_03420 [Gaiellaceae bacterium]|nr:hypothetical protein [Gaiellaceae bacterium]
MTAPTLRCPKCRSTDVGENSDRSVFENHYIECSACAYGSYCDWMNMDEWLIIEQDRAASREARDAEAAPATPSLAPPPLGCEVCGGTDASAAWRAVERTHVRSLVREVHFGVDVKRCACGQQFVVVFTERVDHREGDDDQTWLALPVTEEEVARLAAADRSRVPGLVTELGVARRFLARSNRADAPWFRDGGFTVLPHD